jgi:hypothetical protein
VLSVSVLCLCLGIGLGWRTTTLQGWLHTKGAIVRIHFYLGLFSFLLFLGEGEGTGGARRSANS